jgi:hypothetical protein
MLTPHREAKLQARRDLHSGLQDAAYLYYAGNSKGKLKLVYVRSLTEWGALGDVKGTSLVYAERNDTRKSQIIFLVDQHIPERGDVVAISPLDVWRVDNVEPVYNVTVAANVVRMTAKEAALYKSPPQLAAYSEANGLLPTAAVAVETPASAVPFASVSVEVPSGLLQTANIEVDSG